MTMKKLIRKILRESHDMDWVEDTNLSPYHGVKFTVSRRDYGHPLCSYFILYDAAISDSHTGVNKELVNKPRAIYGESYYVYCDYEGNEEPTANGLKGLSMYSKEGIDDQFDKGNWIRVDNVIDGDLNEVKKILKEDDFDFIKDYNSLDGIKFTHRDYPQLIYTIIDGGGYNIEVTWGSSTHNGTWYQRNRAEALFHNGEWIIYDTINEDHDMDWIEGASPNLIDEINFALEGSGLYAQYGVGDMIINDNHQTIDIKWGVYDKTMWVYTVNTSEGVSWGNIDPDGTWTVSREGGIKTIEDFYYGIKEGLGEKLSRYFVVELTTLLENYISLELKESHDMDWIEDVNSNPLDGLKFKWWGDRSANPTIYIIINVNLNYVAIYLEKYWTGDRMGSTTGYSGEVHKNIALNNINSGEWVIVDDTGSRLPPIF